jgi:tryptophanyl-tRNA synthetase
MSKPVILTGLRTNAEYHLGNYLGAILPMVRLQQQFIGDYQVNMFAPDLHSFTTEVDHSTLHSQTIQNLKVFVAAGIPIDHEDMYLYRQSYVPAHSELTVILNNFAYFGELSRMTQFKDKSEGQDSISAGLFDYPVLMAADILLYGAKYVPVGDDQRQHLELARDLGIRMNNKFGELFIVPEKWEKQLEFSHRVEGARVRSLRNPDKKMSKSVDDPSGTIQLSDSPDVAADKIKRAETDNLGKISWDWGAQPGITNLLQIYEILADKAHDEVLDEWDGKDRYGDLKSAVAEQVANFLTTFQSNLASVSEDDLMRKLETSEAAMNIAANETLGKVQKAVGLR